MARNPGLGGRLAAVFPDQIKHLGAYMGTPPAAPPTWDGTGGIGDESWGMLGNGPDPTLTVNGGNPVGDCGFVAEAHAEMACAALGHLPAPIFTSNAVVSAYLAYDNGQDNGVVLSDVLNYWYKAGKIAGYAPIDHTNRAEMNAYSVLFGGVYCGVNLPPNAETQFGNGTIWTLDGQSPDPNAGHCIWRCRYDTTTDSWVSWGARQVSDVAWTGACVEEAWIIITPELAETHGVNLAALQADIDSIPGGVAPPPSTPPVPTPTPEPHPVPSGSPAPSVAPSTPPVPSVGPSVPPPSVGPSPAPSAGPSVGPPPVPVPHPGPCPDHDWWQKFVAWLGAEF